jgi:membrane-associated phospholipid phosphatase
VAPPARRRLVAMLGAAFSAAVGVALLVLAWHMPSDVVGGYLLATFWAALALAVLRASESDDAGGREPTRTRLGVSSAQRAGTVRAWSP